MISIWQCLRSFTFAKNVKETTLSFILALCVHIIYSTSESLTGSTTWHISTSSPLIFCLITMDAKYQYYTIGSQVSTSGWLCLIPSLGPTCNTQFWGPTTALWVETPEGTTVIFRKNFFPWLPWHIFLWLLLFPGVLSLLQQLCWPTPTPLAMAGLPLVPVLWGMVLQVTHLEEWWVQPSASCPSRKPVFSLSSCVTLSSLSPLL